jgi:tetratricopeptide (TPR) repeat protein
MKGRIVGQTCSVLASVLLLATVGAAKPESMPSGKIPVTTSSAEARQDYLKGQELLENLKVTDARPYFQKAVDADPNFALGHLRLANTATSPESFLASVAKAKALVDKEKVSEGERLWILATDAAGRGDATEANKIFQRLAAAYPEDERAQLLLGGSYFGMQKWEAAIAAYRKSVAINPNYAAPYNQLGYALRFSGNNQEAEKVFKKYTELIPDDPNPYDSYAELLLAMKRHDESIKAYRKALAIDDNFINSYMGIAANLNLEGKHQQARTELATILTKARNDGERRVAHFATAVSYADEGRLDKAVEEVWVEHGIAQKNGNVIQMAQDLNAIAFLQLEAGQVAEAEKNYQKSVAIRMKADIPQSAKEQAERDQHSNGARVALAKGDLKAAWAEVETFRALAEKSGNPGQVRLSHELAGMVALAEKKYDRAIEELQQANQQNPYNLYRLALAYQGKGDKADAKAMCAQVETLNPLNNLNYGLVRGKASGMLASL